MDPTSRLITLGAAAGGDSYWIATLGGTASDVGYKVTRDSSDNFYVAGSSDSTTLVAKFDSSGVLQWQRTLGGTNNDFALGISVDTSGNVYVAAYSNSGGSGYDALIFKYNSSGTIQWQRTLGDGSSNLFTGIAVDSAGYIYAVGTTGINPDILIAKYNSSGTIQWQRTLGGGGNDYGESIALDNSGNIYIGGRSNSPGSAGAYDYLIAKYNSSGTLQWQRVLGGTGSEYGYGIELDNSGNIYIGGRSNTAGAGSYDYLIAKYNNSGVIQWQRIIGGVANDSCNDLAVDSLGNAYLVGYSQSVSPTAVLIVKYDSSGTLQWQRTLSAGVNEAGNDITVDSLDNICFVGNTSSGGGGAQDVLIAKLPSDGSLTGTHGSFTWAASSFTAATSTFTDAAGSLTDSAASLTDTASTFTVSASSLTSTLTTF